MQLLQPNVVEEEKVLRDIIAVNMGPKQDCELLLISRLKMGYSASHNKPIVCYIHIYRNGCSVCSTSIQCFKVINIHSVWGC